MAKKKSKQNSLVDADSNNSSNHGLMGALGANAKTIGTTIAAVLITEIVEAAVERLIQKTTHTKGNRDEEGGDRSDDTNSPNPVQVAASTLKDNLEDIPPQVQETLHVVKSVVSDMKPSMSDVVDALKTLPQESVQRSISSLGNTGNTVKTTTTTAVQDAVNTAKSAVAELIPNTNNHPAKKGKKKGKKKNKK